VRNYLQLQDKVEAALDVACGTGLSTKALLHIAAKVYGTDSAEAMLRNAHSASNIKYLAAPGEQQPFEDASFDLITVCSGIHWLNVDAFLSEARRLLKLQAWLVLYDNFFSGTMQGNEGFTAWYTQVYLTRFQSPPRNDAYDWHGAPVSERGLHLTQEDVYTNEIAFQQKELIDYFITQSNIIAAVDSGTETYTSAKSWLNDELSGFFQNKSEGRVFLFGNWIKYLQAV
jgi:SAM-dependent methyltransferase